MCRLIRQHGVLLALVSALGAAVAAGGGGGGGTRTEGSAAEVARAVELIDAQRYADAVSMLEPYVRQARNDADGHNWLAYAYRKSGRLPLAFEHYRRALSLVPAHRGAHEYIGEACLDAGQRELSLVVSAHPRPCAGSRPARR